MSESSETEVDESDERDENQDQTSIGGDGQREKGNESDDGEPGDDEERIGLVEARQRALDAVSELLEHDLDGVVRVEATDDGWRALVEVVERSAVPDTQDIIGRYEVLLDGTGQVTGYGLVERYRRGDMREEL